MGTARQSHLQVVHFLRKTVTFANGQSEVVTIGTLPAGAVVIGAMSGVAVTTVFNDATNKLCTIGVTGSAALWDASASLATAGFVPFDAAASHLVAADIDVILTMARTGTAATAGAAEVIVAYCPDIDG